jgi:hypothetical protein
VIDATIRQVEDSGEMFYMPELQRVRGEILAQTADERGAEEAFCRSIELADLQSALSWRLRASMSLGRLLFRRGRREEGRQALSETYARFTEGFDTADLKADVTVRKKPGRNDQDPALAADIRAVCSARTDPLPPRLAGRPCRISLPAQHQPVEAR